MFCSKGVLSDTEILLAVRWMGALLWVVGDGGLENESSGLRGPMLMLMVIDRSGFLVLRGEDVMVNSHLTMQRDLSWRTKIGRQE